MARLDWMNIHNRAERNEETTPTAPRTSFVLRAICPAITVSVREMTGSITPVMTAGSAKRLISLVVIRFKQYNFLLIVNKTQQNYIIFLEYTKE